MTVYAGTGSYNGTEEDHVMLAPPFIVTKVEVEDIVGRISKVIEDVFKDIFIQMEEQTDVVQVADEEEEVEDMVEEEVQAGGKILRKVGERVSGRVLQRV